MDLIINYVSTKATTVPLTYIFDGVIFKCETKNKQKEILKCLLHCQYLTKVGIKVSPWNPDEYFIWNMIENGMLHEDHSRMLSNNAYPCGSIHSALAACGIQSVAPPNTDFEQLYSVDAYNRNQRDSETGNKMFLKCEAHANLLLQDNDILVIE